MINGNALPIPGWDGGDGNSAYLDKTLVHQPVETTLDDRVTGQAVVLLWVRAALVSLLVEIVPTILGLIVMAASGDSSGLGGAFGSDSGGGSGFGAFLLFIAPILSTVVFVLLLLVSKLTQPIGEWRVLLHDRTDSVDSTYARIRDVVRHRGFPLQPEDRRMAASPGGHDVNWRLVLKDGDYTANISVFRYGTSLYLGWQMWRSRRGVKLIWQYLGDLVGSITGRSGLEWAMLRTERARAMREAVHAACREGLIVAVEQRYVPLTAGFPDGKLPPVEHPKVSVPAAASAGVPAQVPLAGRPYGYPAPPAAPPRPAAPPAGQPAGQPDDGPEPR